MQNIIAEVVEEVFGFSFLNAELNLEPCHDKFVFVDGEEGDHGIIDYFHEGRLFMIRIVHGGDSEEVILTSYGKEVIGTMMVEQINKWKMK